MSSKTYPLNLNLPKKKVVVKIKKRKTTAAFGADGAQVAPEQTASKNAAAQKKGAPKGPEKPKTAKSKPATPKDDAKAVKVVAAEEEAAKAEAKPALNAGSKKGIILGLLRRPGGATLAELMTATGWQAHSVRGFLSAVVTKKMGLTVESSRNETKERNYRVSD